MKQTIFVIAIIIALVSIPIIASANDSTEVNLPNTASQKREVKLQWYKNMNYTFGYNLGLCYTGTDLKPIPEVEFAFVLPVYWLNSLEIGIRTPTKKGIIETGIGCGLWLNVNRSSYYISFGDTILNDTMVNSATLFIKNLNKYYIYLNGVIYKNVKLGAEFNYTQAYGSELYSNGTVHFSFPIRRDLVGGGVFLKLNSTITLNKYFGINPYLMFKISGSYEIHSTSPYSGLWDKKLTVWYTGLYGGFNLNIGGKI